MVVTDITVGHFGHGLTIRSFSGMSMFLSVLFYIVPILFEHTKKWNRGTWNLRIILLRLLEVDTEKESENDQVYVRSNTWPWLRENGGSAQYNSMAPLGL